MSKVDPGSCWNGNNYFLCRLCQRILRVRRWIGPWDHCGERMKELTDKQARELVEGKKKGPRFKSVTARRGADDLETAERRVKYNVRFRHSSDRKA